MDNLKVTPISKIYRCYNLPNKSSNRGNEFKNILKNLNKNKDIQKTSE